MEIKITDEQIDQLAKAIARANLLAADELADEMIAAWPENFDRRVRAVGEATGAERLQAVRALQGEASQQRRENEDDLALLRTIEEARARREADFNASEVQRCAEEKAQWELDKTIAARTGAPAPAPPDSLRTLDQKDCDTSAQLLHNNF